MTRRGGRAVRQVRQGAGLRWRLPLPCEPFPCSCPCLPGNIAPSSRRAAAARLAMPSASGSRSAYVQPWRAGDRTVRTAAMIRHCRVTAVMVLALAVAAPALAEQPLWELGLGAAALSLPHYRGSDQSYRWLLPVPFGVYRGQIFRATRDGARAVLLESDRFDFDISLAASPPTRSSDNLARSGMPDLAATVEIGPNLNLTLAQGAVVEAPAAPAGAWRRRARLRRRRHRLDRQPRAQPRPRSCRAGTSACRAGRWLPVAPTMRITTTWPQPMPRPPGPPTARREAAPAGASRPGRRAVSAGCGWAASCEATASRARSSTPARWCASARISPVDWP